ncbi:cyclase family protein [Amorphus sp. 3PC139-8]|uniref:cyclase family protein n=1 Tax=Amorphus sp. 3PC139-8 TaxID=2735676 RepID=UPI00345CE16B
MAVIDTSAMRIIDLEFPRTEGMPEFPTHKPGYAFTLYQRHEDTRGTSGIRSGAFGQLHGTEHAGTHIDALSHQAECLTLHGGLPVTPELQTPTGFTSLAAEDLQPIFADGILLDVAALKGVEVLEPYYPVTADDLAACCERQNVTIAENSVVLVYLGQGRYWHDEDRYLAAPGMDRSASEWLAERKVQAVGADNICWDVPGLWDDTLGCTLPGHIVLLVRAGILIIENLDLAELAASGHSQFLFVSVPLKLVGATGSPIRPLALVPR